MQIKENIKAPRHWPLCGEFTGTGEFPAQRASYAENVSIWWRHHEWDRSWMLVHSSTSPHAKHYRVTFRHLQGKWHLHYTQSAIHFTLDTMNDSFFCRFGVPSDCGGVASFLVSEDAAYMTGENVVIAGGAMSRLWYSTIHRLFCQTLSKFDKEPMWLTCKGANRPTSVREENMWCNFQIMGSCDKYLGWIIPQFRKNHMSLFVIYNCHPTITNWNTKIKNLSLPEMFCLYPGYVLISGPFCI